MLIPIPPKLRSRRPAKALPRVAPPGPAALVLVSAEYQPGEWVLLTFDRAINIDALDASQVVVFDGPFNGRRFVGLGSGELLSPQAVRVDLDKVADWPGNAVLLDAGPANGIVPSEGGAAWAGAEGLPL